MRHSHTNVLPHTHGVCVCKIAILHRRYKRPASPSTSHIVPLGRTVVWGCNGLRSTRTMWLLDARGSRYPPSQSNPRPGEASLQKLQKLHRRLIANGRRRSAAAAAAAAGAACFATLPPSPLSRNVPHAPRAVVANVPCAPRTVVANVPCARRRVIVNAPRAPLVVVALPTDIPPC